MRIPELLAALLLAISAATLADSDALAAARFNYDLDAAREVLSETGPEAGLVFAEASLLVAELLRGRYEHDELAREARRSVGREIDRVSTTAIDVLETLPESSERYRLQADLLGTMIRSKFRGMKYQPELEAATDRALVLDSRNANAWVTRSRRPLFAKPSQGGDPALALEYLDNALAIEPDHVQALLFRGTAHARLGEPESAERDWARATELNPNVAGARDRLMAIELPGADTPAAGEEEQ